MFRNRGILICILCLFLSACSGEGISENIFSDDAVDSEVSFKTDEVVRGEYVNETSFQGTIVYFNSDSLKFNVDNCEFLMFYVEEGQSVKKGEKLAECTIEGISAEENEAIESAVMDLTNELEIETVMSNEKIEELNNLIKNDNINASLYELLIKKEKLEFKQYSNEINSKIAELRTKLENDETVQSMKILTAPYDGIIDKLAYISEGTYVNSERWIVQMHSEEEVYIQVTDSKGLLNYNMKVTVETGNNERNTYTGRVVQADNILDSGLSTGKAFILLDDATIDISTFTNILIYAETEYAEDVLTVARGAVYTEKGKKYIVVYENGVAKKRYVTIGLSNAERVVLLTGAEEGMQVIVQ